ncbi:CheR family methyltransferase [Sphingorhabdus sp. M41]|uniref:CheR family methyltransferase n=1 Tax=Sphingorhabdus sp. M41 TaxID=1806885 RepID=UPI00078C8D34|nr:protein-glutamate O-methyltransferase CheR [Sphingorhabdus sp. M41]AMO73446.1 chemotaxis protein CheR [Sphingorhabdus sp. M41]
MSSLTALAGMGSRDFAVIAAIMQREARIHLVESKTTLVESRLARRVRLHGLASYSEYLDLVERDAQERAEMVTSLTTNHTHFFREAHHFDHLCETVLPKLKRSALAGDKVRIWSAGCSSGEEIYTLAMCLLGPGRNDGDWVFKNDVKLLATDISPPVVAAVARGEYSASTVEPVPVRYRDRWMDKTPDGFAMKPEVRALITARPLNLFANWPMRGAFDVIFCRNVMIYFEEVAQAELQQKMATAMNPDGHLYIGHSERLTGSADGLFEKCGQTIYRRNGSKV